MRSISRVAMAFAAVACPLMHGCVSAYDPAGPPRFGIGARTPGMAAPARIEAPAQRLVASMPPSVPGDQMQPEQLTLMPAPAPPGPAPTPPAVLLESPAGEQLTWLMGAIGGRDLRRLDDRFTPEFLARVPAEQLRTILRHWQRDELADGDVRLHQITQGEEPGSIVALLEATRTDRFTQVRLSVDPQGRISSLWLAPAVGVETGEINTWDRLETRLAQLPGVASFAIGELTPAGQVRPVFGHNPDRRMAIASTFKLYILGALAEMIESGEASWDQLLEVRDDLKSLPTGQMQLEREESQFTLERFAALMISISDNTAADHLLHFLGRERVERYMAARTSADERNVPLLSTMEFFRLKLSPDRTLAQRFARASPEEQRAMVAPGGEVARAVPSFPGVLMWRAPYEINTIGWFATTRELAVLMAELHQLAQRPGMEPLGRILRINPGLAFDQQRWTGVAYKGGSEPGVLNMTWLLTRADGRRFVVSTTWNNPAAPVDLRQWADLAGAAIGMLAQDGTAAR